MGSPWALVHGRWAVLGAVPSASVPSSATHSGCPHAGRRRSRLHHLKSCSDYSAVLLMSQTWPIYSGTLPSSRKVCSSHLSKRPCPPPSSPSWEVTPDTPSTLLRPLHPLVLLGGPSWCLLEPPTFLQQPVHKTPSSGAGCPNGFLITASILALLTNPGSREWPE